MKLTREKALRICRELWIWMAREDRRSKWGWPGWKKYGKMDSDCPCCQYAEQREHKGCLKCLLLETWGGFDEWVSKLKQTPCTDNKNSPYRNRDAMKIVRGCEAKLRKMKKKVPTYRLRKKVK